MSITATPEAMRSVESATLSTILAHGRKADGWISRAIDDPECVFEDLGVHALTMEGRPYPARLVRVWRPRSKMLPARTGLLGVWWTPEGWRAKGWERFNPPPSYAAP